CEGEGRPLAGATGDVDPAAVRGDDLPDDGQAQPGTAGRALAGNPVEFLENVRQMLAGDALPRVAHLDLDLVVARPGRQAAGAAPRRVLDGVADQVVEDMVDAVAIDSDGDVGRLDVGLERQASVIRLGPHPGYRLVQQRADGDGLEVELDPALLDPRKV